MYKDRLFENVGGNVFKLKTSNQNLLVESIFSDKWKSIISDLKAAAKDFAMSPEGQNIAKSLDVNPQDKQSINNFINNIGNKLPTTNTNVLEGSDRGNIGDLIMFFFNKMPGNSYWSKITGALAATTGANIIGTYLYQFYKTTDRDFYKFMSDKFNSQYFDNLTTIKNAEISNVEIIRPYLFPIFAVLSMAYIILFAIDLYKDSHREKQVVHIKKSWLNKKR